MKVNRIWVIVLLVVFGAAFYELRLKPQGRPYYERALVLYNKGDYNGSLEELKLAYDIDPNSTDVIVLMGWNEFKLGRLGDAQSNFSRANRLNPKLVEAKMGLDYIALETGQGEAVLGDIQSLLKQDPRNHDLQLAAASAFRQAGRNVEAAKLFRGLLGEDKTGKLARKNLEEMYGLGNQKDDIPSGLPPLKRADQMEMDFRASGRFLQRRAGNGWENIYVKGIDLDPGTPGHFASEAPALMDEYLKWLDQAASLGANTIRVYTALPPAFYRALKRHNQNSGSPRLYLMQEISLGSSDETNLFAANEEAAARQETIRIIDLIHGQGDLPVRNGYANGLYAVDVSDSVLGFLIGRDLPPHVVQANNELNAGRTSYSGKYVSLPNGNATEVWLAGLMDYAVSYEVEKYNFQRPIGFANNPSLDPLTHPSETTLAQEIEIRRNHGERSAALPPPKVVVDDNDAVSVDETQLEVRPGFEAGDFAAYTVFPFYPDFMYRDPAYLTVRDAQGVNPFFGYLKALKAYESKMPLLILEYGVPTSIGVSHITPFGWNEGGLTEREQGDALARMTRNIAEAGCAGGLIFEWGDEWYKANWLASPLAIPAERRPLWNNKLDPDQNFGLWTYESASGPKLFSGFAGWDSASSLYVKDKGPALPLNDGWDAERTLRSLSASTDPAFVYLRLQVDAIRKGPNNVPDLKGANYFIGINTAPDHFGNQVLPGISPQVRTEKGANFLLHISDGGRATLLVSSNYNPRAARQIFGSTPTTQIAYRLPFDPTLERWSGFEEMIVEPNPRRFSRDGVVYPAQRHNRSQLHYRAASDTEDTIATWTCDFAKKAFVFRIPWALLMITDPSSHRVMGAAVAEEKFDTVETGGLALLAVSFRPGDRISFDQLPSSGAAAADSLPALENGVFTGIKVFSWPGWNEVKAEGRFKSGFTTVQKAFRDLAVPSS